MILFNISSAGIKRLNTGRSQYQDNVIKIHCIDIIVQFYWILRNCFMVIE